MICSHLASSNPVCLWPGFPLLLASLRAKCPFDSCTGCLPVLARRSQRAVARAFARVLHAVGHRGECLRNCREFCQPCATRLRLFVQPTPCQIPRQLMLVPAWWTQPTPSATKPSGMMPNRRTSSPPLPSASPRRRPRGLAPLEERLRRRQQKIGKLRTLHLLSSPRLSRPNVAPRWIRTHSHNGARRCALGCTL